MCKGFPASTTTHDRPGTQLFLRLANLECHEGELEGICAIVLRCACLCHSPRLTMDPRNHAGKYILVSTLLILNRTITTKKSKTISLNDDSQGPVTFFTSPAGHACSRMAVLVLMTPFSTEHCLICTDHRLRCQRTELETRTMLIYRPLCSCSLWPQRFSACICLSHSVSVFSHPCLPPFLFTILTSVSFIHMYFTCTAVASPVAEHEHAVQTCTHKGLEALQDLCHVTVESSFLCKETIRLALTPELNNQHLADSFLRIRCTLLHLYLHD